MINLNMSMYIVRGDHERFVPSDIVDEIFKENSRGGEL